MLKIITIAVPLIIISFVIINMIKFMFKSNSDLKRIKDWSDFNAEKLSYVDEISDDKKREYIEWCLSTTLGNINDIGSVKKLNIDKMRKELIDKFGEHIPSLRREIRNNRLNEILK